MIEAKRAECDAANASLEPAIKRRGTKVSATSIVPANEEAVAKKELAQKQTVLKLLSVRSRSIFSYFLIRKPNEDNIEDSVVVVMTPEGATWDAYDQNYADNKSL